MALFWRNKSRNKFKYAVCIIIGFFISLGFFVSNLEVRWCVNTLRDLEMLDELGSRDAGLLLATKIHTFLSPSKERLSGGRRDALLAVILVTTTPNATSRRNEIRNTWKKWEADFPIRVFFFTGISLKDETDYAISEHQILQEENEINDDLIVIDFKEGYYRLTVKVLRMLEWFNTNYYYSSDPKINGDAPRFLVKTDHDVFINIPQLVLQLTSPESNNFIRDHKYFLGGHLFEKAAIDGNSGSKFHICPDFWLNGNGTEKYYPDYLNGPFYIISGNIVEKVFNASFAVPLFPFEDIYLTGMVMRDKLNFNHVKNIPVKNLHKSHDILKDNRLLLRQTVAFHPLTLKEEGLMEKVFYAILTESKKIKK